MRLRLRECHADMCVDDMVDGQMAVVLSSSYTSPVPGEVVQRSGKALLRLGMPGDSHFFTWFAAPTSERVRVRPLVPGDVLEVCE
jgi:hypothetical protein